MKKFEDLIRELNLLAAPISTDLRPIEAPAALAPGSCAPPPPAGTALPGAAPGQPGPAGVFTREVVSDTERGASRATGSMLPVICAATPRGIAAPKYGQHCAPGQARGARACVRMCAAVCVCTRARLNERVRALVFGCQWLRLCVSYPADARHAHSHARVHSRKHARTQICVRRCVCLAALYVRVRVSCRVQQVSASHTTCTITCVPSAGMAEVGI